MADIAFRIDGRITKSDKKTGIHGLLVDVHDKDLVFTDLLGCTRTRHDGRFSLHYSLSDSEAILELSLEIYIKILDRDGNAIHSTKKKHKFGADPSLSFNIALKDNLLKNHFSRPLSLNPVEGPIVPREKINLIEEAFEKIEFGNTPEMQRTLSANLFCPLGPMVEFEDLVKDSLSVIDGDPVATQRFRDTLSNLSFWQKEKRIDAKTVTDTDNDELISEDVLKSILEEIELARNDQGQVETIIPHDTSLALITAAIMSGAGKPMMIHNQLGILLDQFCGMSHFGTIFRAAEEALHNMPGGIERFSRIMKHFGGAWGPDDGPPFPPFPEPQPRPLPRPCPGPWPPDPDRPGLPANPEEIERWACTAEAVRAFRRYRRYTYSITGLSDPNACPGDLLTISGFGFGDDPGLVRFRSTSSGSIDVAPETWSDSEITVIVPEDATCGRVSLRIYIETVIVCDRVIDIYSNSHTSMYFRGGRPRIALFTSYSTLGDCIRPGRILGLRWSVCNADNVSLSVRDDDGTSLLNLRFLPLTGSRSTTLPAYDTTKQLTARLTADGPCGPAVNRTLNITVQTPYNLAIDGMEITQGIQYYGAAQHLTDVNDLGPDNSLQLVANKSAWIRVYMRSGQDPGFEGGLLRNISGTLEVERRVGGVWSTVASLPPQNAPYTAQDSFASYNAERSNINASLNFIVPANMMTGLLRFTVNASSPDACWGGSASDSMTVDVNLQQRLQVAAVQIGYNGPNAAGTAVVAFPAPPLAPPGAPNVTADCQVALTILPVSNNLNLRSISVVNATAPLNNTVPAGGCDANWGPIMNLVTAARTADGNQAGWMYYGFVTQNIPITHGNTGCSSGSAAGIVGAGGTFVHEVGHQLGLGHAPCGAIGSADSRYLQFEPYDPGTTTVNAAGNTVWQDASIGEYGLNINNGTVFNPNPANPSIGKDFMSYCGTGWISVTSHNYMINRRGLNPAPIATGFASRTAEGSGGTGKEHFDAQGNDGPRPLITITGRINQDGKVFVTNVARLKVRYPFIDGRISNYTAELVNSKGSVVSSAALFTLTRHGLDGSDESLGNESTYAEPPFHFIAVLEDLTPGSRLQISKDQKPVWQRKRPRRKPRIGKINAALTKNGKLKVSWTYAVPALEKPEVWLRWSDDGGRNWKALTVNIREDSVTLDIENLPAGKIILQVMAHDGFYTVSKRSKSIKLPKRPPLAAILFPAEGTVLTADMPLHLWGSVISRSSQEYKDEDFIWYLNNKRVGNGIDIWVENPGKGTHRVKFKVKDKAGSTQIATAIKIL